MPPVQWVGWFALQKFKPPDREAHHSSAVSAEVKDTWGLTAGINSPVNVCIELDIEEQLGGIRTGTARLN
jgi:hypothetical protein